MHATDSAAAESAPPLQDTLVVDLSRVLTGPYAAMMLGDMGARVVKVERVGVGDDTRSWGPPFVGFGAHETSTYFLSVNRNKESIALDFKDEQDFAALLELIRRADVLVENFRPGTMQRLGLAPEKLREMNPQLVVLSITGFGHDGPSASRPGYDQIVQGESGLMSMTGHDSDHPSRVGVPIADILAGIFGACGVLAALHRRSRTGQGDVVRTSLLAASVAAHTFQGTRWLMAGEVPTAAGNSHPTIVPYQAFRCLDGMIQIAVGTDQMWRRCAPLLGLDPDDARFRTNSDRVAARETLVNHIEKALLKSTVSHWLEVFEDHGIPAGEIKSLDTVYSDPHIVSQGLISETHHPELGAIRASGSPIRFDIAGKRDDLPPPLLDEHGTRIRESLMEGA